MAVIKLKTILGLSQDNHRLLQRVKKEVVRSDELYFALKSETLKRKQVEVALQKSERHHILLLTQSRQMQEHLRHLTHKILTAQEDERREISRELHDEIAQTLTGINVRLANLKREAVLSSKGLKGKIAGTQRLVQKSVKIVHRFARKLRPALLDDLGLIPALNSFINGMSERTNLPIKLKTFPELQNLDVTKRTVFYRVAQEALTNVVRHAEAKLAQINFYEAAEFRADGSQGQRQVLQRAIRSIVQRQEAPRSHRHAGARGDDRRFVQDRLGSGSWDFGFRRNTLPSSHSVEGRKMKERITVLLAEDHVVVREGLRIMIEADEDIKVVGEAKTGREAVTMTKKYCPDVVVMDIAMPLLNGIQATQQILSEQPKTKVLVLSAHADPEYVDQLMALGVVGYLTKQTSAEMLARAVREVHSGGTFFSPSVAKHLHDHYVKVPPPHKRLKRNNIRLTSRESELLQLIAEGHVNKQIASELNISIKTVEKHRQHLMEKLNIHEIAGLTRYAIAAGVVESSVQQTVA